MSFRNHVTRHLKPFICIDPYCLEEAHLDQGANPLIFETVEAWICHMQISHRYTWECRAPSHKLFVFDQEGQYQEHLVNEHDVPEQYAGSISSATQKPVPSKVLECPFGDEFRSSRTDVSNSIFPSEDLQSHIAIHMKEIALLTLHHLLIDNDKQKAGHEEASGDLVNHRTIVRAGAKRKFSDMHRKETNLATGAQDTRKKPRTFLPITKPGPSLLTTAGWPPELWQQVFTYLSPAMLSRCLRVCRSFKFCLTQLKATSIPRKRNAPLARVLESERLWTQARNHAYPTMPRPLIGFSELRMLQLIGGALCQSCGKLPVRSHMTNVFNGGPGKSDVRVIWPFHVRLCGDCFINESITVR
jgi:hypothetical protein